MHVIVQLRWRYLARLHRLLEIVAIENPAGFLVIQSRRRSLLSAVRSSPVGEHESLEVPILLQNVGKEILVLAGIDAVQAVIRAHYRSEEHTSELQSLRHLVC